MDALLKVLAGLLFHGVGYFISLYYLIRVNYFPATKKSGLLKLLAVFLLCVYQGGCNHLAANFISRNRIVEGVNIQALTFLGVLFILALIKLYKQPETKVDNWPLRIIYIVLLLLTFILVLAFFFS